ncbi:MAG: SDR family NAD(P)-dependent oxidoreductase [Rhodospirillales bacterium]|nr:SDR family NAD(P)-dependent oxidoreductase [Rhodospirillales bacterium]
MRDYRRALITGATSGIGRAFAQELPKATQLLLAGRDEARLAQTAEMLAAADKMVEICVGDLTRESDRDRLVERADAFGIDLLINNAGSWHNGRFLDAPADSQCRTIMVNGLAVVDLSRRLLPGMIARARAARLRAGLIVVSSTMAFAPIPYFATYAASKAFGLHFAEALAEELRREPIDVLALCPGATRNGRELSSQDRLKTPRLLPGGDPRTVAADGLAALGRQTVHISGRFNQAAFGSVALPHRMVAGLFGAAMRFVSGNAR